MALQNLIYRAEVLPMVPISGHIVRLIGQDGEIVANIHIIAMNTDTIGDRALQIANEIVEMFGEG